MALTLYRGLTDAAAPLIRHFVERRLRAGKEDAVRLAERYGETSAVRPEGGLIWIHAASVGESLSVLPVIDRLGAEVPGVAILLTTGTVSSARLLADRLPRFAIHQYIPIDRTAWVRRFLNHWRPDAAIWVESELWPNLITQIKARGIPLALLNARMSDRSFDKWRRFPATAAKLLSAFDVCLAQTEDDARKLSVLRRDAVVYAGNIKFAAPPLAADAAEIAALRGSIGARPLWVAASTHAGEDEIVADAHMRLRTEIPGLLTVIAPRHPARGAAIAAMLRERGLAVSVRSTGEPVGAGTEIYLTDTIGELGLFYALAGVAFIGGSLVPHGGQNMLEAARLDCAIVYGRHVHNFAEIVADMAEAGAAATVTDAETLAREVGFLLRDPVLRARRAEAGRRVADAKAEVLDTVLAELSGLLDRVRNVSSVKC